MTSCDTNILFPACDSTSTRHLAAREFLTRSNPHWPVVDVVLGDDIMDTVWSHAATPSFAYRRIFDARLAATLRHHGVTEFATRNKKDFTALGFTRVWNPLDD